MRRFSKLSPPPCVLWHWRFAEVATTLQLENFDFSGVRLAKDGWRGEKGEESGKGDRDTPPRGLVAVCGSFFLARQTSRNAQAFACSRAHKVPLRGACSQAFANVFCEAAMITSHSRWLGKERGPHDLSPTNHGGSVLTCYITDPSRFWFLRST